VCGDKAHHVVQAPNRHPERKRRRVRRLAQFPEPLTHAAAGREPPEYRADGADDYGDDDGTHHECVLLGLSVFIRVYPWLASLRAPRRLRESVRALRRKPIEAARSGTAPTSSAGRGRGRRRRATP